MRIYKRKTDEGSAPHQVMFDAVQLVLHGLSLREAAKQKGVSKSALCRYVKKYHSDSSAELTPNYSHCRVFSLEQEECLANYVSTCSRMFYGLTPKNVRKLAFDMAEKNNLNIPQKWTSTKQAGEDWLASFLRRNPSLSIRCPEATSLARATAFNPYNINAFFDILEPVVMRLGKGGRVIFNLDETGCTTVQRVPKVIAVKGCKQVGQITSRERGELVTLCGIICASGIALPPVYIFPRKIFRETMMNGAPEGSLGLANASGWMTSVNFLKVLEHFVKHVNPSKENEVILTMDNHDSHLALDCIIYAKKHGINIVTLPPHTSNKTQPLDIAVYAPYKSFFNAAADSWMLRNPGKTISIYNLAELMGNAWHQAATPLNIIAGFKTPGIWPLDRHAFEREGYLPSTVTDRAMVSDETVEGLQPSNRESNNICLPVNEMNVGLSMAYSVSDRTTPTTTPRRSDVTNFVSPEEFRGYPKVSVNYLLFIKMVFLAYL